jgi:hypothetical protein
MDVCLSRPGLTTASAVDVVDQVGDPVALHDRGRGRRAPACGQEVREPMGAFTSEVVALSRLPALMIPFPREAQAESLCEAPPEAR